MSQPFSIEKMGAVPQHAFIAAVAFLVSSLDPICKATAQYGPAFIEDGSWPMELVEQVGDDEGVASSEDMVQREMMGRLYLRSDQSKRENICSNVGQLT